VKYAEQKYIQNPPLKIRLGKIREGGNYATKYGSYLIQQTTDQWKNFIDSTMELNA